MMETEKRLIDANALIDRLKFKWRVSEFGLHRGLESAIAQCNKAPTVDAVEVVHGRWVRCKDWDYDYECSVCEGYAGEDTDGNYNKLTTYCPNCGAKMDGDDDGNG